MTAIPELKIKIKSLAKEAGIIRAEERKLAGERRNTIHQHRVIDVRREQRATLLAYGYLRSRSYRQIEPATRCDRAPFDRPGPKWDRITAMVAKYGPDRNKEAVYTNLMRWSDAPVAAQGGVAQLV